MKVVSKELVKKIVSDTLTKYKIIDVREPNELETLKPIPTSKNIPLGQIDEAFGSMSTSQFQQRFNFDKPNKDVPMIVYCRSGVRAGTAQEKLIKLGYQDVANYKGSALEWNE